MEKVKAVAIAEAYNRSVPTSTTTRMRNARYRRSGILRGKQDTECT